MLFVRTFKIYGIFLFSLIANEVFAGVRYDAANSEEKDTAYARARTGLQEQYAVGSIRGKSYYAGRDAKVNVYIRARPLGGNETPLIGQYFTRTPLAHHHIWADMVVNSNTGETKALENIGWRKKIGGETFDDFENYLKYNTVIDSVSVDKDVYYRAKELMEQVASEYDYNLVNGLPTGKSMNCQAFAAAFMKLCRQLQMLKDLSGNEGFENERTTDAGKNTVVRDGSNTNMQTKASIDKSDDARHEEGESQKEKWICPGCNKCEEAIIKGCLGNDYECISPEDSEDGHYQAIPKAEK